jgi:uncharacterized protein with von Willebrand factor type A (vWA) domain
MTRFSALLRASGLRCGIAETADAARVIECVGLDERETLRHALCAVFAKSEREQTQFFEAFDLFFVSEAARARRAALAREESEARAAEYKRAEQELEYEGKPLNLSDDVRDAYARLPKSEREQIRKYLEFSTDNLRRSPIYEHFMQRVIRRRANTNSGALSGDADAGEGEDYSAALDLLDKNLVDITREEIPRAVAMIQSLVKRLNGAISRDYRRAGKSGRLDFRKTIHRSLRTGGSFHSLVYKKRRRSKKRVVLLCDVSGSMLQFAQFAIRFIKSMNDLSDRAEVYLFSEGFVRVGAFALRDMAAFEHFVKQSGLWGKGTDIARALDSLAALRPAPLTETTALLILSDAKTVSVGAAEASLRAAAKRAGRVIWMNPVPEARWAGMKSAAAFRPYCQMLDCSTLGNLAKACAKLAGRSF